ncbi:S-adenosyl-L-methionine-dependent methyltransferase [Blakeslea trispora]|nr:S-adenosyl-L-methionine-dependent methyltransferase [Blakeslea trispora]
MGSQLSTRRRVPSRKKTNSSISSGTYSDSFHNDDSNSSSCQPKFFIDMFTNLGSVSAHQTAEHYLMKHLFQRTYFAPIDDMLSKPGSAVLDVGCGPNASWLLDMAVEFPNCTFYGFDLVEPLSEVKLDNLIPPNCRLRKHDVFDGFPYEDAQFDYIHQSLMQTVYPADKVAWMLDELMRMTKEDGMIEFLESDIIPKRMGPLFEKLFDGVRCFIKEYFGSPFHGPSLVKRMSEAGLIDIQTDYGSLPVCWGGYIGKLVYEDTLMMFKLLGPKLAPFMGYEGDYDPVEFENFLDKAFDECVEYQTYFNVRWACGRKPVSNKS